jgi:hypothetical protein
VFFSDGGSKTLQKTFLSKSFDQKIDKNPKPFSPGFYLPHFWAFFGEGGLKRHKNISTKQFQPRSFFGL